MSPVVTGWATPHTSISVKVAQWRHSAVELSGPWQTTTPIKARLQTTERGME